MFISKSQSLFTRFLTGLATLGPIGRNLPAPGTWGALTATALTPVIIEPLSIIPRLILIIIFFILGLFASQKTEVLFMVKDPGQIIIDEVVGQWITFIPFALLSFQDLILGFILFRLFDILKPWPVNISENWCDNGWSIMIDDILAAIYSGICLAIIRLIL